MKLLIALSICVVLVSARKSYNGYQVLTLDVHNKLQRQFVSETPLWETLDTSANTEILVAPEQLEEALEFLDRLGVSHSVKIPDMGVLVKEENVRLAAKKAFDLNNWNTYEEIMDELDLYVDRCDNGLDCEVITIGQSFEGRDINCITVSSSPNNPIVWIDALVHAREWLSGATLLNIMDDMIMNYGSDGTVTDLLDKYDWYFCPVVNPDGYSYTFTNERLWRKNRNTNSGGCMGVDLNRNFDSFWSTSGSSSNPCSETYQGASAASEPETQTVQNKLVELGDNVLTAIHMHTYGQYWLHPWGHQISGSCVRSDDHDDQFAVADAAANAIENTFGTRWARGNLCEALYTHSGGSTDFSYAGAGIKYACIPELRGSSFIVNPDQIALSFEELTNGIRAQLQAIEEIEGL